MCTPFRAIPAVLALLAVCAAQHAAAQSYPSRPGRMDPMKMQPREFAAYIKSEINKWSKVVKESGAKPE